MSIKIKPIAAQAYQQVLDDTKLIRLTTLTTITHSIAFLIYIGYTVLSIVAQKSGDESVMRNVYHSILVAFEGQYALWFIVAALILFIGYWLLPSIGEATIIQYLDDEEKQGKKSIIKGLGAFFPMFEYNGMIGFFTPVIYVFVVSRLRALNIFDNVFVMIIAIFWGIFVFFVSSLLAYTKYFISLEGLKPFDAMRKSMNLAMNNIGTTFKAVILQYLLSLRFIINIIVFLGLPLIILYGATKFNIEQSGPIATIIISISVIIGLLVAYINGIIEAFFLSLRYRLFVQLKK